MPSLPPMDSSTELIRSSVPEERVSQDNPECRLVAHGPLVAAYGSSGIRLAARDLGRIAIWQLSGPMERAVSDGNKDDIPSPMMGSPGKRVDIWQWRAAFQRDLDEGEPGIKDLYPNAMVDVYPDEMLRVTDARPYMGAMGVDNMISHPKNSPVLEQMAEGFGTLTAVPGDQDADGRGVWKDGKWIVVFTHPLAPFSRNSSRFTPGGETIAAFAVWEGAQRL